MCQANAQSNAKSDSKNDKNHDQQTPPLEPVTASSMLVRFIDLSIGLVHVIGGFGGILVSTINHRLLHLYHLGHVGKHRPKLRERGLDALELIMTSSNGTKDRRSLPGAVGLELRWCQYILPRG
jgi:hypothetical protein